MVIRSVVMTKRMCNIATIHFSLGFAAVARTLRFDLSMLMPFPLDDAFGVLFHLIETKTYHKRFLHLRRHLIQRHYYPTGKMLEKKHLQHYPLPLIECQASRILGLIGHRHLEHWRPVIINATTFERSRNERIRNLQHV